MATDRSFFVLKYEGSEDFIGLDQGSGGYPYRTPFHFAQRWNTKEAALGYYNMFYKEHHLGLYRANFDLEKVL